MCNTITQPHKGEWDKVRHQFKVDFDFGIDLNYHVPPKTKYGRNPAIVIGKSKLENRPGTIMSSIPWGIVSQGNIIYNARIETAARKALWADAFQFSRLLVPVISFEEPHIPQLPIECHLDDDKIFALAGIAVLAPGATSKRLVILTQNSVGNVISIHNRQPVIVPPESYDEWLNNNYDPFRMINELTSHDFNLQLHLAA